MNEKNECVVNPVLCKHHSLQSTQPKPKNVKTLKMVVLETFGKFSKCSICKLSEIDTLNFGEIHSNKELAVHLFCLYFSTNLLQRGQDNAGILGFEFRDIRSLIKNSLKTECYYCHKDSATTHCHFPKCDRVFHQVCGFKANARFEYFQHFRSYCDLHNDIKDENIEYPKINGCWICYEQLGDYNPVATVPSCCGLWFHQQCLRKYAINAGYAFMCPLCKSKNYADFARRHGIYVPEYEALWEKTHDFRDIERYYTRCDATKCLCPNGTTFTDQKWSIQRCSCCGSYGLHKLCRPEGEREKVIICDICKKVSSQHMSDDQVHPNESQVINHHTTSTADQHVPEQNVLQNSHHNARLQDDIMINLTADDQINRNVESDEDVSETLEEKRNREKAERPIRDEMRAFRIGLWFRDYKGHRSKRK